MFHQLILDLKLYKWRVLTLIWCLLGTFFFGFLLHTGIMLTLEDPEGWICMGTFVGLGVLVIWGICSVIWFPQELMLALSMGRTRREFIGAYALRILLELAGSYLILLVLYLLELSVNTRLYPQYPCEISFTALTDWRYVLPGILCITVLGLFLGSIYSRFRKAAGTVYYFLWIGTTLLLPRMLRAEEAIRFSAAVPPAVWICAGTALVLGMLATVICLGKKQMVK